MHVLIVGDFPDKNTLIQNLQIHRHLVAVMVNPHSALSLMDENGVSFGLIIVPQGPSAKWMGTAISEGLKARFLNTPLIFVIKEVDDDSVELMEMQADLRSKGIQALAIHTPLYFDFIVDQLRPVGVELFNIQ